MTLRSAHREKRLFTINSVLGHRYTVLLKVSNSEWILRLKYDDVSKRTKMRRT